MTKKIKEAAEKLYKLREEQKKLAKEADELRNLLMDNLGENLVLNAGDFIVVCAEKTRTDIDKERLREKIGDLTPFEKVTNFKTLEIKKKKAA